MYGCARLGRWMGVCLTVCVGVYYFSVIYRMFVFIHLEFKSLFYMLLFLFQSCCKKKLLNYTLSKFSLLSKEVQ